MSKQNAITNLHTRVSTKTGWDQAIKDAEELIKDAEGKIDRLRRSIVTFASMRERGEPFPGERKRRLRTKTV